MIRSRRAFASSFFAALLLCAALAAAPTAARADLVSSAQCLQKNEASIRQSKQRNDMTAMLRVLEQCISYTEAEARDPRMKELIKTRLMVRAGALLQKGAAAWNRENLRLAAKEAALFTRRDFEPEARQMFQSLGLMAVMKGDTKEAQSLARLGDLTAPPSLGKPGLVIMLHLNAALPEYAARKQELLKDASALHASLGEDDKNTVGMVLTRYYASLGEARQAEAWADTILRSPGDDPCFTARAKLKLVTTMMDRPRQGRELVKAYGRLKELKNSKPSLADMVLPAEALEAEKQLVGDYGILQCLNGRILAYKAANNGDFVAAVRAFEQETARRVRVFGKNSACAQEAALDLANLFLHVSDTESASARVEEVGKNPATPQTVLQVEWLRAQVAMEENDPSKTVDMIQTLMRLHGAKMEPAFRRGLEVILADAYWRMDKPEEGRKHARLAQEQSGRQEDDNLLLDARRVYLDLFEGRYGQALKKAEKVTAHERRLRGGNVVPESIWLQIYPLLMLGRHAEAAPLLLELLNDQTRRTVNRFPLLSERQAERFVRQTQGLLSFSLDLAAREYAGNPGLLWGFHTVWLQRKGLLLEAQSRVQAASSGSLPPDVREQKKRLDDLRARFERLRGSALPPAESETMARTLQQMERKIIQSLPSLLTMDDLEKANPVSLAAKLPPGGVLLDFARVVDSGALLRSGEMRPDIFERPDFGRDVPHQYLAFILREGEKGGSGRLSVVRLGDAASIDRAVAAFRRAILRDPGEKGLNIRRTGADLRLLLLEPLKEHLAGAEDLYVSPDSQLLLLPFEAIPGKGGTWLVDEHILRYLAAPRDLLARKNGAASRQAVFVGAPDFSCSPGGADAPAPGGAPASRQAAGELLRDITFSPLPHTLAEVNVGKLFLGDSARVYTGCAAKKQVLRDLAFPPRILHLATHGFFLPDDSEQANPADALLRSGLAFAGANAPGGGMRGVLFADEVLAMDLRGTELVVLSACETGLGEVMNGEGVYGLRRSFLQAGTRSLVMSLWAVADQETGELMNGLYAGIFSGASPAVALHNAVLAQKKASEQRHGFAHPLYWAGFIYLGKE